MNNKLKRLIVSISISVMASGLFHVDAYAKTTNKRLYGKDRYVTAVQVSKAGWVTSDNVVLATGEDFPDALCAGPLAKKLNAPIILTGKDTLSIEAENEINRLKAKNVYIIGGQGVVSTHIEKQLKSKGIKCKRIYGMNRFETSVAIAKELGLKDDIVVATGLDFPDALSVAPIAASKAMPILLVDKDYIPSIVEKYLSTHNISKSYIIGGSGVISNIVASKFKNNERIAGNDRYSTNVKVLDRFSAGINFNSIYIATGVNFPDALTGSALAAKMSSGVMLVNNGVTREMGNFIKSKGSIIDNLIALGGEANVSTSVLNTIEDYKDGKEVINNESDFKVIDIY